MEDLFNAVDVEAFRALELHEAESKFDEVKARIIFEPSQIVSLHRVRAYLHLIEDILAERHETRRADASRGR